MNVDHLKVLVMVERMSNMIGAVVISSNVVQTRSAIVAWLKEFGLTSGACSVRLVTDAEVQLPIWLERRLELLRSRSKEQSLRTTRLPTCAEGFLAWLPRVFLT